MKQGILSILDQIKIPLMRDQLLLMMQNETSIYGQLFFQQQIITYEMANTITSLRFMASSINPAEILPNTWAYRASMLPNKPIEEYIDKQTLGQLLGTFKEVIPTLIPGTDELTEKLDKYVDNRNHLTHKMLIRFESYEDILVVALATKMIGDTVLRFFRKFDPALAKICKEIAEKKYDALGKA